MLFIGRPLPLIILAVIFYTITTSHFRQLRQAHAFSQDEDNAKHGPAETEGSQREQTNFSTTNAEILITTTRHIETSSVVTHVITVTAVETATSSRAEPTTATSGQQPLQTAMGVDVKEYMEDMLKWQRPNNDDHWPPYQAYRNADYDPNRWEAFEEEKGYYVRAGINQLEQPQPSAVDTHFLYPDYNSPKWKQKWKGEYTPCDGPRGKPIQESQADLPRAFGSVSGEMPAPLVGSAEALGLSRDICLDRVQRYGPYGFNVLQRLPVTHVDWKKVRWGELQNKCLLKNHERWAPSARDSPAMTPDFKDPKKVVAELGMVHEEMFRRDITTKHNSEPQYHPRTAVLIRTWEGYDYSENDIISIRAMITELSLATGGEYQVFLFVNIKDRNEPIYTNEKAYKKMLEKHVPEELRDIAILWNEDITQWMYPGITDWQVYWHQFMCVQWFSETHPEFDFIWNWEMDTRYIGNHYDFLTKVGEFAKQQPRKYLWERNARYYFPKFHGNNYTRFIEDTNALIHSAASSRDIATPVWGPLPYSSTLRPLGPSPPWPMEHDNFTWGVGEAADLITLLPIWDPEKTQWTMRNKIWNFTPGIHPVFNDEHPTDDDHNHPSYRRIPRRAYINTCVRFSRRLLHAMHAENLAGRTMQAEMWPTTAALHHGFKAVYAPHPIYSSHNWAGRYADMVFNRDGGVPTRWGQEADSIYNQDRECNFRPWSWYYHAEFPRVLWRRWMGWKARDGALGEVGGEEWERKSPDDGGPDGRMCLPPMLLHPVKRHDLENN